ncbi:MAG: hypothetical protein ACE37I_16005 [Rubinisphaera brasiliensis]|uniref:hypothetical protein n=1 Tax=Rubinisphaera brasiliensis TaxID=119 RepID=UPI00391B8539|nr:hypothetical protein [bacterium]
MNQALPPKVGRSRAGRSGSKNSKSKAAQVAKKHGGFTQTMQVLIGVGLGLGLLLGLFAGFTVHGNFLRFDDMNDNFRLFAAASCGLLGGAGLAAAIVFLPAAFAPGDWVLHSPLGRQFLQLSGVKGAGSFRAVAMVIGILGLVAAVFAIVMTQAT